ncbi:MAG: ATP-dependent RNA helicase HrpA [Limisphaerales bacterium]
MDEIDELRELIPRCLLPDQVRLGRQLVAAGGRWSKGDRRGIPLGRWLGEARASVSARAARSGVLARLDYPPELPITAARAEIVGALRAHAVLVVAGETGSGKTTQLPKMCLEAGLGLRARIGCTQPRRVAAMSISRRIAEELRVDWGREVGCKIRFADHSRPETSVKVMTDGILLAEVQADPLLTEYEAILLDEAHERSLNIDLLLGHLIQLRRQRDDLRVIITSATIDTARFSQAFDGAPVIEVSGRLFPVEIRHRPVAEEAGSEETTFVDAAVAATNEVLRETAAGDVLVFMPGERDIRETCDDLRALHGERLDVVPLFGRLSAGEQQGVFSPGPRRRVVVATNIAETSVTVPRIRYVVDTGLARINRYHPGTRTNRLPVEPIARSSANQRAGRCGRVADGVCVRLYSEEDFLARPMYPEPEIQRSDLADVILRMKACRLGEVETFPFLDTPGPAAISGAYTLLQELGALDDERQLLPLGRDLARLPVDPAIGRMLLQAREEKALEKVLVIAAGLSIQDPRERPLERRDAAEAAHRRFHNPQSDFLTLLRIWDTYHVTWESLRTQSQLRKFCQAHFLSYLRMREWVDVHAQLSDAIEELEPVRVEPPPDRSPAPARPRAGRKSPVFTPEYAAIHRSILTGLFGHVAERQERNLYRAAGGRQVMIFPGSGLFEKPAARAKPGPAPAVGARPPAGSSQPAWMVAGEIVETTRPYARTVAAIDPEWVIELAPHLCRASYDQPYWDADAGRVMARERRLLRGLVLRERRVGYGQVNPREATDLFIRAALLPEEEVPWRFAFQDHNRRMREKIEVWQTRLSQRMVPDLTEALAAFYAARLTEVSSIHDLNRVLKASTEPDFLCATAADLVGGECGAFPEGSFPDRVSVEGVPVPVEYAYAPGEERDGVTLRLPVRLVDAVDPERLAWAVPALREERVAHLLRGLPKALRKRLMPLAAAAAEVVAHVRPESPGFLTAATHFIRERFGVDIPPDAWPTEALPEHLRPRLELVGTDDRTLATGRDLNQLREVVRRHDSVAETGAWQRAVAQWERYRLSEWSVGDLPERIVVSEASGLPFHAFPGLHAEEGDIHLRLFRRAEAARGAMREAVPRLLERVLHREVNWVQKELRSLRSKAVAYAALGTADALLDGAWVCLQRHLFPAPDPVPRTAAAFAAQVEAARSRLPGLAVRLVDCVGVILERRQALSVCRRPFPGLADELSALVPADFLARTAFERLSHLLRYLQALQVRADRAAVNPAKDAEKAQRVRPYLDALRQLQPQAGKSPESCAAYARCRWLIEEFKVSIFAQEIRTAEPVSPKRLEQELAAARATLAQPG